MKTFRSQRGPFKEQLFFTDDEIERICLDELRKVNLLPTEPSPTRIDRFVEKRFGINGVDFTRLPEGVLGLTRFGTNGVEGIYVADSLAEDPSESAKCRIQSTIAHEAGHGLLHAHLFAIPEETPLFADVSEPHAPKVLCRESNLDGTRANYKGEWWEFQANEAMGHLLMPRPLLQMAVQPFLIPVGNLGGMKVDPNRRETCVRTLAQIFGVNPVVARIRIDRYYGKTEESQLML